MASPAISCSVEAKANRFYELSQTRHLFDSEFTPPNKEQIIAIASYIETSLADWEQNVRKACSFAKHDTHLARTIIYNPAKHDILIKLGYGPRVGALSAFGRYMVRYDLNNPKAFPTMRTG